MMHVTMNQHVSANGTYGLTLKTSGIAENAKLKYNVYWGDGTSSVSDSPHFEHVYQTGKVYRIEAMVTLPAVENIPGVNCLF